MIDAPRKVALDILIRIEKDKAYSNLVLDSFLVKYNFNKQDSAFVTALVYGVLENLLTIDYLIKKYSKRDTKKIQQVVLNIMRIGVVQLLFMDKIPESAAVNEAVIQVQKAGFAYIKGFVNAVLREIARNKNNLEYPDKNKDYTFYLEVAYSCPSLLINKWMDEYGEEVTVGILKSLKTKPPYVAKVNTLKTNTQSLLETFENAGFIATKSETLSDSIEMEKLPALESFKAFQEGMFYIQDYASMYCCLAVDAKEGQSVLDMCAAPGGKSFTIAGAMNNIGSITACELFEGRKCLIKDGANRLGIKIINAIQNDSSIHNSSLGLFDKVLCDVPCSGLGVLRRKPEVRYKNASELTELPQIQYKILCEGANHCKDGGNLIYSTCTLNKMENEDIVLKFLREHPEFIPSILPPIFKSNDNWFITMFPHINNTDGFFIAIFERKESK
jgi:16S rRNA (cytosine967-C5)-methyltransferase